MVGNRQKKRPVYFPRTTVIFFLASCSCQMKLDTCSLHVNDFGCPARDLNLTVFSMVIFLCTFKRRFPSLSVLSHRKKLSILLKLLFWLYPSERKYRNTSSVKVAEYSFLVYRC